MPELPEAETIARVLREELIGQRAEGRVLEGISRHGKAIVFEFDGAKLVARLGMTGIFRLDAEPDKHTRCVIPFERRTLLYHDIRKFGRLTWNGTLEGLGPDVLAIGEAAFAEKLARRERAIKPLLLDQSFVAGLGNIYVDECLYAARVHPLTPASRIDARDLYRVTVRVLEDAIAARGSTISDFRDPWGKEGAYQKEHRAYGRAGAECSRCGERIVRAAVAQRGTHYCPRCQARPAG